MDTVQLVHPTQRWPRFIARELQRAKRPVSAHNYVLWLVFAGCLALLATLVVLRAQISEAAFDALGTAALAVVCIAMCINMRFDSDWYVGHMCNAFRRCQLKGTIVAVPADLYDLWEKRVGFKGPENSPEYQVARMRALAHLVNSTAPILAVLNVCTCKYEDCEQPHILSAEDRAAANALLQEAVDGHLKAFYEQLLSPEELRQAAVAAWARNLSE